MRAASPRCRTSEMISATALISSSSRATLRSRSRASRRARLSLSSLRITSIFKRVFSHDIFERADQTGNGGGFQLKARTVDDQPGRRVRYDLDYAEAVFGE